MFSRRNFIKTTGLSLAGMMAAPSVYAYTAPAASKKKKTTANDKINIAFIGLGQQCMHLLNGFINMEDVRVVAGCDVYDIKRSRFEKRVRDFYSKKGEKKVKVDMYEDYQDVLAREDVDAVVIATPDHQHCIMAMDACKAGKDVYLEKPLTLTVYEGQMLCKAVRKYNRILQVGSMQRSCEEFIHAANLCREGLLGQIDHVQVYVGRNVNPNSGAPIPTPLTKMEIPAGLNWDKWLGPMSDSVFYHSDLDPIVSDTEDEKLWGAWRWYKPTGGGLMTDWGAHMFDIAQWMLGKDNNGPVEIIPAGYDFYKELTFKYDNGIIMTEENINNNPGVRVFAEEGVIEVHRGSFTTSNSKFEMKKNTSASDAPYETQAGHYGIFTNSIRSRIDPNVPVETGHSSCTVCNLANIAIELNRPIKWNPIVQKFMNDEEATKLLHYQYRDGYKLEL